jgi:hypothetical protein
VGRPCVVPEARYNLKLDSLKDKIAIPKRQHDSITN